MSRIGQARELAAEIAAKMADMPEWASAEVERCWDALSAPLVRAINAGYVTAITEEALEELALMAAAVEHAATRGIELASSAKIDDELIVTDYETGQDVTVRVTARVVGSRFCVVVQRIDDSTVRIVNLFWSNDNPRRIVAG